MNFVSTPPHIVFFSQTEQHYCPANNQEPLKCPAGTYNPKTNAVNCIGCPAGYYGVNVGANSSVACSPCLANTYNSKMGASSCDLCDSGIRTENGVTGATLKNQCNTFIDPKVNAGIYHCLLNGMGEIGQLAADSFCKFVVYWGGVKSFTQEVPLNTLISLASYEPTLRTWSTSACSTNWRTCSYISSVTCK